MTKENSKQLDINRKENHENIIYILENTGKKMTFSVTPIYKKSAESLKEILTKLMRQDIEKP